MPAPAKVIDLLHDLIAAPSVSSVSPAFDSSNKPVISLLAEWLLSEGFEVEILPLPGQPNKANLIATLGSGSGGLVLAGHTDTVPFDAEKWNHDPFKLTEADNRLYGLGMSDMKSFFALAIEAARGFDKNNFQQPLIILATADEESTMDGAKALVELGKPKGRYAVIGEPTGLKPINAHKGMMMESVRLTGRSGHSSDPTLGISALEGMQQAMTEILKWREELQSQYRDALFAVPFPTLNLGHIHGGDNPNRICGCCDLHIDLRPLPGMELEELRATLQQRLFHLLQGSELELSITPLFDGTPAMHTDKSSAIVSAAEKLTGHAAGSVAFCTEGPYLNAMGMETVILGPGDIAQAHQPDEFLALDRIQPTIDLLKNLIQRFCMEKTG